jgi:hypothetical protein
MHGINENARTKWSGQASSEKKKKKNQGKTMPSSCIVSECHTEQHGSRAKMKTHL